MRGSASKTKAIYPARVRFGRHGCPMLSHLSAAGGTAKVCADWAFVSGVSPVSPYLKLIDRIQRKKGGYGREGINRPKGPCAETGGTGATVTRASGETTRARRVWDRWDHPTLDQGVTVRGCDGARTRRLNLVTRLRGSPRLALILGGSSNALPNGSHRG